MGRWLGVALARSLIGAGLLWAGALGGGAVASAQQPALTEVAGSPFANSGLPYSVAFSLSGGLLAAADALSDAVSVFSVGPGGALAP